MKRSLIVGIVIVTLIIVSIIIFYLSGGKYYDESKEIDLGFSDSVAYLKECKLVYGQDRANLSTRLRVCPSIPEQEIFDKLETIKDLKGILECDDESEGYSECRELTKKWELLTSFSYHISATSGGHVPSSVGIEIYKYNRNYYLSKYSGPPPKVKIFMVQLSEEEIDKLV